MKKNSTVLDQPYRFGGRTIRVLMITFFQFAGVSLGIFFRHIFHLIKSEN